MASATPTAHFFVRQFFCAVMLFVWTVSAKDFPHIYNGRNLRKTPPTVATEGRRTLILIYLFEEETNRNIRIDGSTWLKDADCYTNY